MRALVTGAGGFIGSHLVESLLDRGHDVRALVRYNGAGTRGFLDADHLARRPGLEVRAGDVQDPLLVRRLVEGCDRVFHLAALIGIPYSYQAVASYVNVNVTGALNVLEASREAGVERVLLTSTSEVYGSAVSTPMDEGHRLAAQSPYAATKIASDQLGEAFFRSFGLPVTIVRPFNTYGPRQSARAIIPAIAAQLLGGCSVLRLGSLAPERDFTFVTDTVAAFLALADSPDAVGRTFNVGSGRSISIGRLAERLMAVAGRVVPIETDDERVRPASSEVDVLRADAGRLRRLTGWEPRVGLDEGLRLTLRGFLSAPPLGRGGYQV